MKTYSETLDFLYSQLPQYQKIGSVAYKANLDNIIAICRVLGKPQKKIKTIHVAGSNGKGSVSHILASILQEAGYKVGLYTSPHLKDFRERIKINGKEISKEKVIDFVNEFQPKLKEIRPSFFEWTVGLAFYYFTNEETDINLIETGLGGRLDSTNIITPEISVITNISLEHTAILGDTIEKIAKEKAGIIKPSIPVVIGKTQPETKSLFEEIARENNSNITFADSIKNKSFEIELKGKIQQENANTAFHTIQILDELSYSISNKNIEEGLKNVVKNTNLLGRFQLVSKNPMIILDTAHNPDGLRTLVNEVTKLTYKNLRVVIGIAKDKNQIEMLTQFSKATCFYFCSSTNERVLKGTELKGIANKSGIKGTAFDSVEKALKKAKLDSQKEDLILVTGSNFVVADII